MSLCWPRCARDWLVACWTPAAFAPGGVVDLAARLLSEEIQKKEGVSIIIENRPGANGALAARAGGKGPH